MSPELQYFFAGMILSIAMFILFGAKRAGEKGKVGISVLIYINKDKCLHIHHWMIFLALLIIVIIFLKLSKCSTPPPVYLLIGFLVGGVLSGFRYSDAFVVKKKCRDQD